MNSKANNTEKKEWKSDYLDVLRELEVQKHIHSDERNQNHKLLLQIIFSCAGLSSELDDRIDELKLELHSTLSEEERHQRIMEVARLIPQYSRTPVISVNENPVNHFTDFLSQLSLPGEIGAEIIRLRKRQQGIQEEKQQLEILQDTIKILKSHYKQSLDNETILLDLLEHMCLPKSARKALNTIKDQLLSGYSEQEELKNAVHKIADLISEVNRSLQLELDQVQAYLNRLIKELLEIGTYLDQSGLFQVDSLNASQVFHQSFQSELNILEENISDADDLDSVRATIDAHLKNIKIKLDDHLHDAEERFKQAEDKNQELNQKLFQMHLKGQKLKKVIRKERKKAQTDALTGIPNRLAFDKQIQKELSRCERYQHVFCLAIIDVDNFKCVNDNFGHRAGDKVLKTVAEVCADQIRDCDFLARYGGEEFVVILPQTESNGALITSEKLRSEIEKCHFYHQKHQVPVTISVGIAQYQMGDGASSLFTRADKYLYQAKEKGRNCCLCENGDIHQQIKEINR